VNDIVFRADSITHSFGRRRILNAATLWARQGAISGLLGRNGSGKTTLFRIAAGLLTADQGVVIFDGHAFTRPRLHQLARRGLFLLPERGLLPRVLTLGDVLRIVAERFDNAPDVDAVADRLRITDLLQRTPDSLSGGEMRRAEVAIAAARAPRVLLADEPFMGIAPADADIVATALRELAADGCAIVVSGHEVEDVLAVADEVVWITAGTTHGLGNARQARQHWQFQQEYLGAKLHQNLLGRA
jgi:ABC-type lipopolysaccharide export system ATPase subunit